MSKNLSGVWNFSEVFNFPVLATLRFANMWVCSLLMLIQILPYVIN